MFTHTLRRLKYRVLNNNPFVWFKKLVLARSILKAAAQPVPSVAEHEIHVLVCSKDFLCVLWALRSFYYFSRQHASLTIHDDGTLKAWHYETLARLFPGSRTISRAQSDFEVNEFLAPYPQCQQLRKKSFYNIKLFDFPFYTRGARIILLDSDVLFFAEPSELLIPCQESCFNSDIWTNYLYTTGEIKERFGLRVPEKINIGLGVMSKGSFDFSFVEGLLDDEKLRAAPFFIEQTIIAILASRGIVRMLGPEYQVSLSRGITNLKSKHYTRLVRHLFFLEGLPYLAKAGLI